MLGRKGDCLDLDREYSLFQFNWFNLKVLKIDKKPTTTEKQTEQSEIWKLNVLYWNEHVMKKIGRFERFVFGVA